MGTYKEWIESLKRKWIGKRVKFEGGIYNVVDVDYNGFLLIDKKARHTETTAVARHHVEAVDANKPLAKSGQSAIMSLSIEKKVIT